MLDWAETMRGGLTSVYEGVSARDPVGMSRRLIALAAEVRADDARAKPNLTVVEDEPYDPEAV